MPNVQHAVDGMAQQGCGQDLSDANVAHIDTDVDGKLNDFIVSALSNPNLGVLDLRAADQYIAGCSKADARIITLDELRSIQDDLGRLINSRCFRDLDRVTQTRIGAVRVAFLVESYGMPRISLEQLKYMRGSFENMQAQVRAFALVDTFDVLAPDACKILKQDGSGRTALFIDLCLTRLKNFDAQEVVEYVRVQCRVMAPNPHAKLYKSQLRSRVDSFVRNESFQSLQSHKDQTIAFYCRLDYLRLELRNAPGEAWAEHMDEEYLQPNLYTKQRYLSKLVLTAGAILKKKGVTSVDKFVDFCWSKLGIFDIQEIKALRSTIEPNPKSSLGKSYAERRLAVLARNVKLQSVENPEDQEKILYLRIVLLPQLRAPLDESWVDDLVQRSLRRPALHDGRASNKETASSMSQDVFGTHTEPPIHAVSSTVSDAHAFIAQSSVMPSQTWSYENPSTMFAIY
jgi:hypothetical protein